MGNMNKKGIEIIVGSIVIIILALIVLTLLVWVFSTSWKFDLEPEFKITKEECRNITIDNNENSEEMYNKKLKIDIYVEDWINYGCFNKYKSLEREELCEGIDYQMSLLWSEWELLRDEGRENIIKTKTCGFVEVDVMETGGLVQEGDSGSYYPIILKYDLTIEWLNENCECVDSCKIVDQDRWIITNGGYGLKCGEGTICNNKYQCQDYLIEVEDAP